MSVTESKGAARTARDWALALGPYRQADMARAMLELAVTFPPFAALWAAMLVASIPRSRSIRAAASTMRRFEAAVASRDMRMGISLSFVT